MRQFALIVSAVLLGLTATAAAQPALPAEAAAPPVQIRFDGYCDGLEIRVTGNYVAALPIGSKGCDVPRGVAVGTIVRPRSGSGQMLVLGQNLNDENNFVAMFLISYPLTNGGTATLIATNNGKTVQNGGSSTYSLGRPRSTRESTKRSKSFLSQFQRAE